MQTNNYQAVWALLSIALLFIASKFGYTASLDPMLLGGVAFAGLGNIELVDINALLLKQGDAFDEFKSRNDSRLSELEKDIIEISKKQGRSRLSGLGSSMHGDVQESKQNLAEYIRSRGEVKAMHSGSSPDGGYIVQPVLQEGISTILRNMSVLRDLITFIPIESGNAYEEIVSVTPVGAKWVGERESRPATESPKLVKIKTVLHEEYAEPVVSQALADDSGTNMVDFLINDSGLSFAEAEELALFYGDGISKPLGLLNTPSVATTDSTRDFGKIEHVLTGVNGGFSATAPLDIVKELFFRLRAGYRVNAKWVMNSQTALALSKVKDKDDNYLWDNGSVKDGTPVTLMGKPVIISESCPDISNGSKSIWFGDWDAAFRGIERPGNKVLLDQLSDKPNLIVYIYRRVGLQLRNSNALKCAKFSAA